LEGLRKATKTSVRTAGVWLDLKQGHPKYASIALPLRQTSQSHKIYKWYNKLNYCFHLTRQYCYIGITNRLELIQMWDERTSDSMLLRPSFMKNQPASDNIPQSILWWRSWQGRHGQELAWSWQWLLGAPPPWQSRIVGLSVTSWGCYLPPGDYGDC
jgi:hypothetical protein